MLKNLSVYLRYDWPLHFILLLTNWLPDNVIFLRFRGALIRPFLASAGKNITIGRNVTFHDPAKIYIGHSVHISYGCMFMATDVIKIDDEVMFGPYCVIISGNHTRKAGSYRFGEGDLRPIHIGKGSWLGAHVVVTAGTEIGQGVLIAASAVVAQNIPSDVMAGGIPAKVIRPVFDSQEEN